MDRLRLYRGDEDMDELHPIATMGWAAALGAIFGLGAVIHDQKAALTPRAIIGVLLYSGGNAFVAGCCWHLYVTPSPLAAIMIGASAGLFGFPAKNLLAFVFKKSGIVSIRFNRKNDSDRDAA